MNRGLYRKYEVNRVDGRDASGEKHEDCLYFVIDIDHHPWAADALKTIAEACSGQHPALAFDLTEIINKKWGKDWMPYGWEYRARKAERKLKDLLNPLSEQQLAELRTIRY